VRRSGRLLPGRSRSHFILGRALCLNLVRNRTPIRPKLPFHKRLRIVLEGVRKRVGAGVADWKPVVFFHQNKINLAGQMLNRPRCDIARNTHMLPQFGLIQRGKLGNRVVLGLAFLGAHPPQCDQRCQYNSGANPELQLCVHVWLPPAAPQTAVSLSQRCHNCGCGAAQSEFGKAIAGVL